MAKRVRKNKSKKAEKKAFSADYLTLMPGILMCAMILLVLILDLFMTDMADMQYEVFPGIFTSADYTAAACMVLFVVISVRQRSLNFDRSFAPFAAFALLIVISTCLNGLTRQAVEGIPFRYIGIFNMFAFLLAYMWLSGQSVRESLREKVLLLYLAAADLVGISALIDLFVMRIPAYHAKKELSAIFFNGNHYGYFLLMAILIGIGLYIYGEEKVKIFGAASAALNGILLALNHSMGCILAVAIVTAGLSACIFIYNRDRSGRLAVLILSMAACLAAALIFSPAVRNEFISLGMDLSALLSGSRDSAIGHNRLLLWKLTAEYIKERPLLGYGCEGIAFGLFDATGRSNPHSEILTYAAYYGIPAAICYLAGIACIFVRYFKNRRQTGISSRIACMAAAGYFISSFAGVAMFYTVPFFFIFLGLMNEKQI